MDSDKFNMSMRKFLKQVGVTSQQRIEEAVRQSGTTTGSIKVRAIVTAPEIGLEHVVEDEIELG